MEIESTKTIFSFQTKLDDDSALYIFANEKGLTELADILEAAAFRSDSDFFISIPNGARYQGDPTPGHWGGNNYFPIGGWYLQGGAVESTRYNPERFHPNERSLINEKVIRS